ncbi:MAG: hypothetical protein K0R54_1401 [Clostridiaceae bacterium]|jgi:ubiquinone/menaquinone biosynthesis C-methylase UbiE|nr:hypothetical protein [Clostridiaceae bacterium]
MVKQFLPWGNHDIFINFEKEIFKGNILDIGLDNYGIIYNIIKNYDDKINVDYINGQQNKNNIEENFYDSCILFFAINGITFNNRKKHILNEISKYLKNGGNLYIWDINKGFGKLFKGTLKIAMPKGEIKKLKLNNYNLLSNNSYENIVQLLKNKFNIIDCQSSNEIYYIKAEKINTRKEENNESTISGN